MKTIRATEFRLQQEAVIEEVRGGTVMTVKFHGQEGLGLVSVPWARAGEQVSRCDELTGLDNYNKVNAAVLRHCADLLQRGEIQLGQPLLEVIAKLSYDILQGKSRAREIGLE